MTIKMTGVMLFYLLFLLIIPDDVQTQPVVWIYSVPVACNEDSHCPVDSFCKTTIHVCVKCLDCQELKRFPPEQPLGKPSCLKSVHQCGSCLDGWVLNTNHRGLMCVPAEAKSVQVLSKHIVYIWFTYAACGLLITLVFLYVLRNTDIFKIVKLQNN